jgi:hypothetical protein
MEASTEGYDTEPGCVPLLHPEESNCKAIITTTMVNLLGRKLILMIATHGT